MMMMMGENWDGLWSFQFGQTQWKKGGILGEWADAHSSPYNITAMNDVSKADYLTLEFQASFFFWQIALYQSVCLKSVSQAMHAQITKIVEWSTENLAQQTELCYGHLLLPAV